MSIGSSPMPIKGWLLPGLGSGHARVTRVCSAEHYYLGLTPSLSAVFPHPSWIYQRASGRESS